MSMYIERREKKDIKELQRYILCAKEEYKDIESVCRREED